MSGTWSGTHTQTLGGLPDDLLLSNPSRPDDGRTHVRYMERHTYANLSGLPAPTDARGAAGPTI